jgi:hypothetical protein
MIHDLTAGYLDRDSVRRGKTVALRPLDPAIVKPLLEHFAVRGDSGEWTIGDYPVYYQDG